MEGTSRLATALLVVLSIASVSTTTSECPETFWPLATLIPHESDCTSYYICSNNQKILSQCGLMDAEGNRLHFDPEIQSCVWPNDSKCISANSDSDESDQSSSTEIVTESGSGDGNSSGSDSTETIADSSEGSGSEETETTNASITECPPDNEGEVILISDESDCRLFYTCVHGQKVSMKCPEGLGFNPASNQCDWPEITGCIINSSNDSDSSESGITNSSNSTETESSDSESDNNSSDGDDSLESSNSDETEAEVIIPTKCPVNNEGRAVHIADESNCTLFYTCDHGNPVKMECPAGLHFNAVLQVCDWPAFAGCTLASSDNSTTTEASISSSSDSVEIESSSTENNNVTDEPNHPTESESSSTGSNNATDEPDHPAEPESSSTESNNATDEPNHPTESESSSTGSNNATDEPDHPAEPESSSTESNNATDEPNHPTESESSSTGSNNATDEPDHPAEPESATTESNNATDEPDHPVESESSSTESNNVTDEPNHPTESEWLGDESSHSSNDVTSSPQSDSDVWEGSSDVEKTIPTECPASNGEDAVLIAHESDCSLYYKCDHGNRVEMPCPTGLHFNPALQVCDWPASAGCTSGNSDDEH